MPIKRNTEESSIDNSLELIKFATEVQSKIKEDVTSDFVLAKFANEKDEEAIKEMINNARMSKRMITELTQKTYWTWNKKTKTWEKKSLDKETEQKIQKIADVVFEIHMIRLEMKAILNRNKENNPILSGLMKTENNKNELNEEQEETIARKIESKLTKKDKKEEEK